MEEEIMHKIFSDQLGRKVSLNLPIKRIVSVVPSQTELLYDLGLEEEVAGITKFCVHPNEFFRSKRRVGGTKKLNFDSIRELNPDLIIANKEENDQMQINELANSFPVWISDIYNLEDALAMISSVGAITNREEKAAWIVKAISASFSAIKTGPVKRVAYFIWKDPYMVAGANTFINDMIERMGFENVYKDKVRYPEVDLAELNKLNCDYLFLSSEPYPFKEKHFKEFSAIVTDAKPVLVDGEMFSWYGSRLIKAATYFESLKKQLVLVEK